jgi:hypothetical protein
MNIISEEMFRRKLKIFGVTRNDMEGLNDFYCVVFYDPGEADLDNIYEWCEIRFKDNWIWSNSMHISKIKIWFKNTDDALLFKLTFNLIPYDSDVSQRMKMMC